MSKSPLLVAMNDLQRHAKSVHAEVESAIDRVIRRGWFVLGPELLGFEAEWADFCGVAHGIGVGNGTEAMELTLRGLGIRPGDQVATVANAGLYSTTAIRSLGAEPVYVEVLSTTMNMDPEALREALSTRVRAVIVTHLYGRMANIPALLEMTRLAGIPLIEDCAQAHGAALHQRKAGSWGVAGCFSFYPTKNLGAFGDAGAIVTHDSELAARLRQLRQYGWGRKYQSDLSGGRNSRMDEIQAAVLRAKLPSLDAWNERRRCISAAYTKALSGLGFVLPEQPSAEDVAHLYVLRTDQRSTLQARLSAAGIASDIHYPIPDYLQPSMKDVLAQTPHLPRTEEYCNSVLSLPCYPELADAEQAQVIEAIHT